MLPIAIMQGRISPPSGDRLQFFPADWAAEFPLAKKIGFSGITWFFDRDAPGHDPLRVWADVPTLARIDAARDILPIDSIDCGRCTLFGFAAARTEEELTAVLPALAQRLSSRTMVIPMLLEGAPRSPAERAEATEVLGRLLSKAVPLGLRFALETEMPADELADFVDSFSSPALGACYDIGSATAYGFDCPADIVRLHERVFSVHLKDHKKGDRIGTDPSVPLGTGDADFRGCFAALNSIRYQGSCTLQAWRGADYLGAAAAQLAFAQRQLSNAYGN